jgi:hypothetical protein
VSYRFPGWVGALVLGLVAASAACGSRDKLFVLDDEPASGGAHAGSVGLGGQSGSVGSGGRGGSVSFGGHAGGVSFGGRGGSVGFAGSAAIGGSGFAGSGNIGGMAGSSGFSCQACLTQIAPNNPCAVATCDFVNNRCKISPQNEGALCGNGNFCKQSACQMGQCVTSAAVTCPQMNQCFTATCDPKSGGCLSMPLSGTACDDGDPCTLKDQCTAGKCLPGVPNTVCQSNDKCCPAGCNSSTDNDCPNAAQVVILANDRGWYTDNGTHAGNNKNTFTGYSPTTHYNTFFNFDLSAVSGQITAAQLVLEEEAFFGTDMSETASIWDVSTSAALLSSSTQSSAVFQDLQSGSQYGSITGVAGAIGSPLSATLSKQALADLNAARGRAFSIGVHIDTLSGQTRADEGLRFGMGSEARRNELILTVQ